MLSIRRGTDQVGRRWWRPNVPLGVSLAVNGVVLVLFFQAATTSYHWLQQARTSDAAARAERVAYVPLPRPAQPGRAGGDDRPVAPGARPAEATRATPRLRAPSTVPTGVEPAPPTTGAVQPGGAPGGTGQGGSGAVVGEGGPTVGIKPSFGDPRLWGRPAVERAPLTPKERLDSAIAARLAPVRDSIAAAQALAEAQRKPGDWTVGGPGGKWGMDPNNIHLGKVKIPTAVLGLLSSNFQRNLRGNPTELARERQLAAIREDLQMHAQREMSEDQFREAVKQVRARKDRERAARLAARQARGGEEVGGQPPAGTVPQR